MGETTITVDEDIKEGLDGLRAPGQSWNGFFAEIIEDAEGDEELAREVEALREEVNRIPERVTEELEASVGGRV